VSGAEVKKNCSFSKSMYTCKSYSGWLVNVQGLFAVAFSAHLFYEKIFQRTRSKTNERQRKSAVEKENCASYV
jgi:hypothetical protein